MITYQAYNGQHQGFKPYNPWTGLASPEHWIFLVVRDLAGDIRTDLWEVDSQLRGDDVLKAMYDIPPIHVVHTSYFRPKPRT